MAALTDGTTTFSPSTSGTFGAGPGVTSSPLASATTATTPPAPVSKPTTTVSSKDGSDFVTNKITPAFTAATNNIAANNAARAASVAAGYVYNVPDGKGGSYSGPAAGAPNQSPPPAAADTSATMGTKSAYHPTTGDQSKIPVEDNAATYGLSDTNPKAGPAQPVVDTTNDNLGNTYKKFADGTYGMFDSAGKYLQPVAETLFQQNKDGQSITASYDAVINGNFPLSGAQLAQIQGIKDTYAAAIKQQGIYNDNLTGGTTVAMNLYGMGNSIAGHNDIAAVVAAGAAKITDLQNKMAADVAAMQAGFDKDNLTRIKAGYDSYVANSDKLQAQIDKHQADALAAHKAIQDQNNAIDANIRSTIDEAAKGGASPDQIAQMKAALAKHDYAGAIAAGGTSFQDPTSTAGQYAAYVKDAQAKGLTPASPGDFLMKQKIKEASAIAYAQADAKNKSDAAYTTSDKVQQSLEQQGRAVVEKELSGRTGDLGIENLKVGTANHLNALITQYYNPKTGAYDIPTSQYYELAIGLANMVANNGQTSDTDRKEIAAKTAAGDLKGALQYVTGTPQNGNTQAIIKNLVDSVDRQAETAVRNRQAALDNMKDMLPTDLEQSRKDALIKSTQMMTYEGQDRISKATVDAYVKANPADSETIAKLYEVPGATNKDIEDYLRANGKIK